MSCHPTENRARGVSALAERSLDVLIVGGGIVGAAIARDAALRGLSAGLIEQHDFAFGASSRSSRLLHGGLRYLAQGRLGLVREASVEKRILHEIAPHLCRPLAFVFPAYQGTDWPLWQLRVGVKIYDLLCGGGNFGKSSALSRSEVLQHIPALAPAGLAGAVRYFDALTNDARLVIDTLRSAAAAGATPVNYCRFERAEPQEGMWRCQVHDGITDRSFEIRARTVVNATGPWAGGLPHSHVKLRLTKGIHIVIDRTRLPVPDAVVITQGKRILFVIPWAERLIVGTTDTDYDGPIDEVRSTPQDVAYLLSALGQFFPTAAVSASDVISVWAGLRPLIARPDGTPSNISRSHQIRNPAPGWWDVAGGKLTTCRLMAEETVDQIVKRLKAPNHEMSLCRTALEPLLPPSETTAISGIEPPVFSARTIEHFCHYEWAVHLDDVMLRRAGWQYYYGDTGRRAEQAAGWMAECWGWNSEQMANELARYQLALDVSIPG